MLETLFIVPFELVFDKTSGALYDKSQSQIIDSRVLGVTSYGDTFLSFRSLAGECSSILLLFFVCTTCMVSDCFGVHRIAKRFLYELIR